MRNPSHHSSWVPVGLAVGCLWVFAALGMRPALAAEPRAIDRLVWMEGVWVGEQNGVMIEETWSSPAGGGLVGMHKDSRGGRMVGHEFFRIIEVDTLGVCYFASPAGRAPTRFCASEWDTTRVVFENPSHDFPQRVSFWLDADGRMHARIDGVSKGTERAMEWVWTRRSPVGRD